MSAFPRAALVLLLSACGAPPTPTLPAGAAPPPPTPPQAPARPDGRPPTPSPSVDLAQAGPAMNAWARLLAAGCDLDAAGTRVWTPVEARVLRNVPFAVRGWRFGSAELSAFFNEDGAAWYEAHTTDVRLPQAEQDCVDRLKAREEALRSGWPLEPAREARLVTPTVFRALQAWGAHATDRPYGPWTLDAAGDGGWSLRCPLPDCGHDDCGGYSLECPATGACVAVAAG